MGLDLRARQHLARAGRWRSVSQRADADLLRFTTKARRARRSRGTDGCSISSCSSCLRGELHVRDDVLAELAALDLRRAFHQPREVISHPLARDRAVETLD